MRYAGMKQGDIWYVTFGPDKADKTAESMVRSTLDENPGVRRYAFPIVPEGKFRDQVRGISHVMSLTVLPMSAIGSITDQPQRQDRGGKRSFPAMLSDRNSDAKVPT